MIASGGAREELVALLLEHGARVNVCDRDVRVEKSKSRVSEKKDLICGVCWQFGQSALMLAAERGHIGIVERLLAAGADSSLESRVRCR